MNSESKRFPYSPDKFVDREDEITLVLESAQTLAQKSPLDKRTIIFEGEPGVGKSWLLFHLKRELAKLSDIVVFLLNLTDYKTPDSVLVAMTKEVLGQNVPTDAKLPEMSQGLMQGIRRILEKKSLALLLDSVYESDWKMLAALEHYLFAPLAVEPSVLIVMSGRRGHQYSWKMEELKFGKKSEFHDLQPFGEVETSEQVKRQGQEVVWKRRNVHRISGGNPLANYWLATRSDLVDALNQVVEETLGMVPDNDRPKVRGYLEALCVLRAFDEEYIPGMLEAYYDDKSYSKLSFSQSKEVRQELVHLGFARWKDEGEYGGYVLEKSIRRLLENHLKSAKFEKWKKLHAAACQLYEDWKRDFPRTRDRWQEEIDYHFDQLQTFGSGQPSVASL